MEEQWHAEEEKQVEVGMEDMKQQEEYKEESKDTMRAEPDFGPHLPLQHISSGS